jgi:hypothetical protein
MQHIVFANNWWLCALSEAMARQGTTARRTSWAFLVGEINIKFSLPLPPTKHRTR